MTARLRVALVGCGQIADAHLQEIRKTGIAEPVAVCDRYLDLARQAAQRFSIAETFGNLPQMLEQSRPDVLHVTTPPQTHRDIALAALDSGVHVYVEKPFAVNAHEAAEILNAARHAERLVCVGHDHLFDPLWRKLRARHDDGELGRIVHVDSVQGYDLSGSFGKAFATDPDHWVHRLPGSFFQNTISHALYKITEFLCDERPDVDAIWFPGDERVDFPTELRVTIRGKQTTGSLISSCTVRPVQRVARLYGTRQLAEIDFDSYLVTMQQKLSAPGAFAKLQGPYRMLSQAGRSLRQNLARFARSDLQYFGGMNSLFAAFYRAILSHCAPPIAFDEILRVTAIMDDIFAACRRNRGPAKDPLSAAPEQKGNAYSSLADCKA